MQKNTNKIIFICQAAMIAALYVVLTYAINAFNLASGAIQVRVSEALTILPFFTPAAIPGLVIGCFIANLSTGAVILDVIFGTLATLLGALGTYALRKYKWLAPLPPNYFQYNHCTMGTPLCLRHRQRNPLYDADSGNRRSPFLRHFGYAFIICTQKIRQKYL